VPAVDYLELSEALERARSSRIALRPVAISDAYPLFAATRNPKFNRYLLWDQPQSLDEVLCRVELIVDASRRGRMSAFSAVAVETGEWMALYRFQPDTEQLETSEVGIWTSDKHWYGKISLEVMRLCFSAAFTTTSLNQISAGAHVGNRASRLLMEQSGMSFERHFVATTENGFSVPAVRYGITAQQWLDREPLTFSLFGSQALNTVRPIIHVAAKSEFLQEINTFYPSDQVQESEYDALTAASKIKVMPV